MPTILNPIITNAGLAAAQAQSGLGLQLAITHVQLGSGGYTLNTAVGSADYNRTSLVTPKETVAIGGGHVAGTGFRVDAMFTAWVGAVYGASEIGFWAGNPASGGVLFAYWAQPSQFVERNNIDYLASFAVALARVPAGSVTVTFDPDVQKAIALVTYHEQASNPHNQYVKKSGDTMTGDLVLPMVPQFDESTKAANMAALQRALGNYRSLNGLVPPSTLTAADVGKAYGVNSAGDVNLPVAGTCKSGTAFAFMANVNGVVIKPSGGNNLYLAGTPGFVNLSAGDSVIVVTDSLNWWVFFSTENYVRKSDRTGELSLVIGTVPKPGTIKANGALLSRTTYARLWAHAQANGMVVAESTWASNNTGSYSSGDGATNFRVPDLRGYALRVFDDGRGVDAGRVIGSNQGDQLLAHNHAINDPGHAHVVTDAGHTHGYTDPGHVHTVNNPTHTHTLTDAGHTHTLNNPAHTHTLNNPAHTHGIVDPTHNHVVTDPGHTHSVPHATDSATSGTGLSGADHTDSTYSTGMNTTGVTLAAASTGITVANATTAVTANNATTAVTANSATTGLAVNGVATAVSLNAANAGIVLNSVLTGVGVNPQATGISTANSSGGTEVRVKNIAVLACIYY